MGRYGIDWSKGLDKFKADDYDTIVLETTKIIENNVVGDLLSGAYYDRGIIYSDRRNYEKAILDFTFALQLNFHHPGAAYYNRGLAYYMIKKMDLALFDFNKANNLNPNDEDTLYMIKLITSRNI